MPRSRPLRYSLFSIGSLLFQVKLVPVSPDSAGNATPDLTAAVTQGEATLAVTTPIIAKSLQYFGVVGQAFFSYFEISDQLGAGPNRLPIEAAVFEGGSAA